MQKAIGSPVLIQPTGSSSSLERVFLGAGTHDEAWLQQLIFDHPQLLPITRIEPGFGTAVPVAREVPCGHGYIDNLYLTPSGEIVLVETKLWRNVQARREVVAQALDYVSALMSFDYERFEAAIIKAAPHLTSLYAAMAGQPEALDEASFTDAVSRNLGRGRMLVIVLGDGIRQEAEALAQLLQSHAGAHFTFALVELATWRNQTTGEIIAIPSTLAQTVMIERGILLFGEGAPQIKPVPAQVAQGPRSISEEMFFEALAAKDPALPMTINAFLKQVEPLGVYADLKASLNLKADLPEVPKPVNFGYIQKNGQLWTDPLAWFGHHDAARNYNHKLAKAIGGVVHDRDGKISLTTNGSSGPRVSLLLPAHADIWAEAIKSAIEDIRASEQELAE